MVGKSILSLALVAILGVALAGIIFAGLAGNEAARSSTGISSSSSISLSTSCRSQADGILVYTTVGNISIRSASSNQTITTVSASAPSCCTYSVQSFGNLTLKIPARVPGNACDTYSFPAGYDSTLGSPQVQPLIRNTYLTELLYYKYNESSPIHQCAILNITGSQVVSGDWTGGYHVSYLSNKLLNITIEFDKYMQPPRYVVTHVSVYGLSDRKYLVSFTPQQKQVIRVALANNTVNSLMADHTYYVRIVYPYGGGPLTGTQAVQLFEVNGAIEINVNVSSDLSSVVAASAATRSVVILDSAVAG
jgi:hypothetical protein